jgi:hypothetical protein
VISQAKWIPRNHFGIRPSIPTLKLTTGDGDDITQPVGTEHTIDKAVGSYGALELSDKGSIEAVLGVAKATHNIKLSLIYTCSIAFTNHHFGIRPSIQANLPVNSYSLKLEKH